MQLASLPGLRFTVPRAQLNAKQQIATIATDLPQGIPFGVKGSHEGVPLWQRILLGGDGPRALNLARLGGVRGLSGRAGLPHTLKNRSVVPGRGASLCSEPARKATNRYSKGAGASACSY